MIIDNVKGNIKIVNLLTATVEAATETAEIDFRGYNSGLLCFAWKSTLASDETLTVTVEQASGATTGFSRTYADLQAATVVYTDPTTGATYTGDSIVAVPIDTYARFGMFRITAATSVGSGNIDYSVVLVMGGAQVKEPSFTFTTVPITTA